MMKKLLKNLTFVTIVTTTSLQAQDSGAYLHLLFENNLTASTTKAGGIIFQAYDPGALGYTIPYGTGNEAKEGTYALNYSTITNAESPEYNLINNNKEATILSTTSIGFLGSAARTFAAWIRYDNISASAGSHCIMEMGNTNSTAQGKLAFILAAANNYIQLSVGGGNVTCTYDASVVEDGNWHHIAFTYAAGAAMSATKFYIDGELSSGTIGGTSTSLSFNTTLDKISIGSTKAYGQKWFDGGGIDDLRVYDYALTATEIKTIYGGSYLSVGDMAFEENELKAYPNAVEDFLYIETTNGSSSHISVSDINGKIIKKTYGNSVDMSSLLSGMYVVNVRQDNKISNLKILKK